MYLSENYAVTVGEVSIFEVSDAAYAEELQSILQNRLDRLRKVAKEYAPARPQNSILWKYIASAIMFTWLRAATTMLS